MARLIEEGDIVDVYYDVVGGAMVGWSSVE